MIKMIIFMYIICWIGFIVGFIFIKSKSKTAIKLEKFLWNSRIKKMQNPPFKTMMEVYEKKKYLIVLLLVIGININVVILQSLLGYIMLSPITVLLQGFIMGSMVSQGDEKTIKFALFVCIFELGAFSTSGAIGFHIAINTILTDKTFLNGLKDTFFNGYYLIPFTCLLLNGIFEASGVFFGVEGVPGIKAVKEQMYK